MTAVDRSQCAAGRHGDRSAYDWWGCRCPDGREAHRLYRKRLRHGRQPSAHIPAIGTARRLQGLVAIGYSWRALAAHLGVSNRRVADLGLHPEAAVHRETAARVDAIYQRLSGTPGGSKYALAVAARHGFAPPLAWDNIDDPVEQPNIGSADTSAIDAVRLDRALSGSRTNLTPVEKHHAVHRGIDKGMPLYVIADRMRMSYNAARSYARRPLPEGHEPAA